MFTILTILFAIIGTLLIKHGPTRTVSKVNIVGMLFLCAAVGCFLVVLLIVGYNSITWAWVNLP